MNDVLQFDLTPPSEDELRILVADLSEDERQVLLEHGKRPSAASSSRRNGEKCTPAVCADCRCSRPARSFELWTHQRFGTRSARSLCLAGRHSS